VYPGTSKGLSQGKELCAHIVLSHKDAALNKGHSECYDGIGPGYQRPASFSSGALLTAQKNQMLGLDEQSGSPGLLGLLCHIQSS
jgi:hypothetical protein